MQNITYVPIESNKKKYSKISDSFVTVPDATDLSIDDLRRIEKDLPAPSYTERIHDTTFEIFVVKHAFSDIWKNDLLRRLIVEARKTYRSLYGEIPLIDEYDKKSVIYLVKSSYALSVGSVPIQCAEWLTVRFVPAGDSPVSNEDLDFYLYKGTHPIFDVLLKKIKEFKTGDINNARSKIVALSRLSAIRPYPLDTVIASETKKYFATNKRNFHTALSFALVNKYFLQYAKELKLPIQFITCQMHEKTTKKTLSHALSNEVKLLDFVPLYRQLGVKRASLVAINRNNPQVYIYRYPGYFLDIAHLSKTLRYLLRKKRLTPQTIQSYLDKDVLLEDMLRDPKIHHFRHMGKLFMAKGEISPEQLTGEELRSILSNRVQDGVKLYLMRTTAWEKSVNDMIRFAKKDSV